MFELCLRVYRPITQGIAVRIMAVNLDSAILARASRFFNLFFRSKSAVPQRRAGVSAPLAAPS